VCVAMALETSAFAELKMCTTTSVVSVAVPVKDGVVSLDGDAGLFNVTVGEAVSTIKDTVRLLPSGFPSELSCVATAVYSPLGSSGLAWPELQSPPFPVAVALETSRSNEL